MPARRERSTRYRGTVAADIAFYGLSDYPMIARLLRALACTVPEFEFNSLRRWLSFVEPSS